MARRQNPQIYTEYVVALHTRTEAVKIWEGTRFRTLDSAQWTQYKICMLTSEQNTLARKQSAIARARDIARLRA
jgi:hypothetical protein